MRYRRLLLNHSNQKHIEPLHMKHLTRANSQVRNISNEIVASLSQTNPGANVQFHSASGGNRRTAKRPASQQPAVRQRNPNPNQGRALRVVAGGALGEQVMDLHFPQFPGIACRRDVPLAAPQAQSLSDPGRATPTLSASAPEPAHKAQFVFEHKPLVRNTGIND